MLSFSRCHSMAFVLRKRFRISSQSVNPFSTRISRFVSKTQLSNAFMKHCPFNVSGREKIRCSSTGKGRLCAKETALPLKASCSGNHANLHSSECLAEYLMASLNFAFFSPKLSAVYSRIHFIFIILSSAKSPCTIRRFCA